MQNIPGVKYIPVNQFNELGNKNGLWVSDVTTPVEQLVQITHYVNGMEHGIQYTYTAFPEKNSLGEMKFSYDIFTIGQFCNGNPYGYWQVFGSDGKIYLTMSNVSQTNNYRQIAQYHFHNGEVIEQYIACYEYTKSFIPYNDILEADISERFIESNNLIKFEGTVLLPYWDIWSEYTEDVAFVVSPFVIYGYDSGNIYGYLCVRQYRNNNLKPYETETKLIPLNAKTLKLVQAVLRKNQ